MSRVRTFLAIELDPAVRTRLLALQESLGRASSDVKWVEEENLHLTLLFLGEVDERELLNICRAAQRAVADIPVFTMSIESARCFGSPRRPRTLWVGVGLGAQDVVAVHDALEKALLELGCYRREERQYTPHVTLGRGKGDRPSEPLAMALQKHQAFNAGESRVEEVLIMSSQLTPKGPIYTVMGRAKLA